MLKENNCIHPIGKVKLLDEKKAKCNACGKIFTEKDNIDFEMLKTLKDSIKSIDKKIKELKQVKN